MSTELPTGIERPIMRQEDVMGAGGGTTLPDQSGHAGEVLSTDGTALEWIAVGGTGTVTSVGMTVPAGVMTVTGSPITAAGTLAITFDSQTAGKFLGSPAASTGAPSFRALTTSDIPSLDVAKITSGVFSTARLGTGTADNTVFLRGDGTWATVVETGTVASVGLSLPGSVFSVSGSPVTSSGTLAGSFVSQSANQAFMSPNGSSGAPSFRAIALTDIPTIPFSHITGTVPLTQGGTGQTTANAALNALLPTQTSNSGKVLTTDGTNTSWATASGGSGTVTSVALSLPSFITVSGSPVTTSGTLTGTLASQTQNYVFAAPFASSAAPVFRLLDPSDIPSLATSKITSGTWGTAFLGSGTADNTKFLRGDSTWQPFTSGTVTSVGVVITSVPELSVSGSPVTGAGSFTFTKATQSANTVWAGPTSGGAAVPTFRALDPLDIPALAASKITSGTFTTSQIPSLDASKITSGTFSNSFIDTIGIAKGGTGQTTANAGLNALLPTQTGNSGKYLQTDGTNTSWAVETGAGTVTSVDMSVPAGFSVTGNPITTSGTLAVTADAQSGNKVYSSPSNGSSGTPAFRALVAADIPDLSAAKITSGTLGITVGIGQGGTGQTTANAALNALIPTQTSNSGKYLTTDGTDTSWGTPGTVSSVALSAPSSILSVGGSPVTTTGTLALSLATQTANYVWAGPTSGGAATPTFRAIVAADLPTIPFSSISGTVPINQGGTGQTTASAAFDALAPTQTGNSGKFLTTDGTNTSWGTAAGTVTSVALSLPSFITVSGSPVTTTGTLTGTLASQTQNYVFAAPFASSAAPVFRLLDPSDIPALATSKITSGTWGTAFLGSGTADSTKFLRGDSTWQTFTSGTVTSVGVDATSTPEILISGSATQTITSGGTFTLTKSSQTANTVWAGPTSGSPGSTGFRALVSDDIPALAASKITSGTFSTGLIPALDASKITTGTFSNSFIDTVGIAKGGTGQTTANAGLNALLPTQTGNSGKVLQTDGTNTSWATSSGGGGTALTVSVAQTTHGLSVGDVIKSSGSAGAYAKAQADTSANAEVVGIVTAVADANNFTYTLPGGYITTGVPAGTAGDVFFLSTATAGAMSTTDPLTSGVVGEISKPVLLLLESAAKAAVLGMRGVTVSGVDGWNVSVLASDVTNNNGSANTIADVTGLSFAVTSGDTYEFEFFGVYTAAATATGSRWSINGPATTFLHYQANYSLTTTSQTTIRGSAAYDLPAASNATSASTGSNIFTIKGIVKPSANGTVIARFASEVSSSAIVAKGGMCYVKYRKIA